MLGKLASLTHVVQVLRDHKVRVPLPHPLPLSLSR